MTDNITRLYELAGVKKKRMCDWTCQNSEVCDADCEHFMQSSVYYPPFTAEKQLKLIKWVSDIFVFRTYTRLKKEVTCFLTEREYGCDEYYCKGVSFEQALSGLIMELWNDLTHEQKKEVKRILE